MMSRTQEKIRLLSADVYARVDVGKSHLDVFIHPSGVTLRVCNNKTGIQKLVRQCELRIPTYPDSHSDGIRTLIPEYPDKAPRLR